MNPEVISQPMLIICIAFAFGILVFPQLTISHMGLAEDLEKFFFVRFFWAPTMLNLIVVRYVRSFDLEAYTRDWVYQKIYCSGSFYLVVISSVVTTLKNYEYSYISNGMEVPHLPYFLWVPICLPWIMLLLMESKCEYEAYLNQKAMAMARLGFGITWFGGRYRARKDDDDFKSIADINN